MLATCVHRDWPVDTYLEPSHPLQQQLRMWFSEFVGSPIAHEAVDGCGSPAWAVSLTALAGGYRSAVLAPASSAAGAVAAAMREHPEFVGGSASEVTGIMRAVPGVLCKDGAEAVYAAALPDGRAVALKISDGGFRAGQVVLVAALKALGAETPAAGGTPAGTEALDRFGAIPVLGHGRPVGHIRPLDPLSARTTRSARTTEETPQP
jgi:L-asparaginase II